jgi:hypothetical protein
MDKGIKSKKKKFFKRKRKRENIKDVVHGFSVIGSLGPDSCPCTDLSELRDAISCDRKVQGKF